MKLAKRKSVLIIILLVSGLLTYACLAGPLFAWSPLKPGYQERQFERATVAWPTNRILLPAYLTIDLLMNRSEQFHQLKFQQRVNVIACDDWADFHRFVFWIRGTAVGAVTLDSGDAIFVTPKIEQMHFDTGEFLGHELSHAIIDQNAPWINRPRFRNVPWLYEGMAVLAGDQHSYGTFEEFVQLAKREPLNPMFTADPYNTPGFNIRLAYRAWRYFLADRIELRGRDRFQDLLHRFIEDPNDTERAFQDVYGESLATAVGQFQERIRLLP